MSNPTKCHSVCILQHPFVEHSSSSTTLATFFFFSVGPKDKILERLHLWISATSLIYPQKMHRAQALCIYFYNKLVQLHESCILCQE